MKQRFPHVQSQSKQFHHCAECFRTFKSDDAMLIWSLLSLLAMGCYAYALCVLLLTRQENPLLYTALCGCLAFGLTAMVCLKSRHWVLGALHAFVATVAGILLVALLMI